MTNSHRMRGDKSASLSFLKALTSSAKLRRVVACASSNHRDSSTLAVGVLSLLLAYLPPRTTDVKRPPHAHRLEHDCPIQVLSADSDYIAFVFAPL